MKKLFRRRQKSADAKPSKMRRRILALVAVGAVVGVFVLVATLTSTGPRTLYQRAHDNIAEARFFMKQADSDNERVQFFSGLREENYRMDGRATRAIPFALINVEPKNANHLDEQRLQGTLQIGEESIDVTLERNQFGRNFAADIGRSVDANTQVTFTLKLENEYTVVFELNNVMQEDAITWEDALKIAVEHLEADIKDAENFETYVKIITNQSNVAAFWFVQFITDAGDLFFVVIGTDGSVIGNQR